MSNYSIKDLVEAGYTITIYTDTFGRFLGTLMGRRTRAFLKPKDLKIFKDFKNIHKLLKEENRFIKLSGRKGYYLLQMLELHYDDEFAGRYMLEDFETSEDFEDLLKKYDDMKKTNDNRMRH